ncbi:hypothetical protein [Aeromonas schubertii]|uniref:hypothetical protein n=1 Tax=Aeromonas schubertii TaxID=652 RepID=UPI00128EFC67|nr:hypothetical protein [Aeromonas schubertii]
MSPLEEALKLERSITEEEGNNLAERILNSECSSKKELVYDVATALWNIGQHRYSGEGFSKNVSDMISHWLEKYFDENVPHVNRMIDVIYELTSEYSDEVVKNKMGHPPF